MAPAPRVSGAPGVRSNFSDVPDNAFYHDFVQFLVDNGITAGCGPGLFCGEQAVTRGQVAVFLKRLTETFEIVRHTGTFSGTTETNDTVTCPAGKRPLSGGGNSDAFNLFITAQAGEAQVATFPPTSRTFGTANVTAHVIGASEFDPLSGTATGGYTSLTKFSNNQMVAWVRLPSGAVVQGVELEACDTDSGNGVSVNLFRRPSPNGLFTFLTSGGVTGIMETPGWLSLGGSH